MLNKQIHNLNFIFKVMFSAEKTKKQKKKTE